MAFGYPVALELSRRRCVVVGGGELAEEKVEGLLQAGADVTVLAESFTDGLVRRAGDGRLDLVARHYRRGDLEGAFLAVAATGDTSLNAEIHAEAEERGVLLNAVDDIAHCHFALPAVLRQGDFVVTVGTGGKAPALAKRVRGDLSRQLGPEYGTLVDVLGQVRERALGDRRVSFDTWARRWASALDRDLLGLVRGGRLDEAKEVVHAELAGGSEPAPRRGRVSIVGAGPGDPGLLSVRGKEALEQADVVVCDRLVHTGLLEGKEAIDVGKAAGGHAVPQEEINKLLIGLAAEGRRVARLKGGDPFVFGRGSEEAEALADAGVDFEVVPAPTSALAALAYAGIPATDRRLASSVAIVTGHCVAKQRAVRWREMATAVDTIVVLMARRHLGEIVAALIEGGRDPATPAAVVEDGTLPSQRVTTTELARLPAAAAGAVSPALVVIGEVVALRQRIDWFAGDPHGPGAASSATAFTRRSTSDSVL